MEIDMADRTHPDSGRIITSGDILLHDAQTALMYEELRAAIDDGHESMTHADALATIAAIRAENVELRAGYAAARLEIESLRAALATPQPAPQQEAQGPCQTCVALARTVMLDQVSFDRKPDCYGIRQITDAEGVEKWEDIRTSPDVAIEEANDMMATGRGEIYEVVPLWTTPQLSPAPQADSVLEDAARWGELRAQHEGDAAERCCVFAPNDMRECLVPVGNLPGELDAFIDAKIAARKQGANHD